MLCRATIVPPEAGVEVHFRAFDVDDPSANGLPIDDGSLSQDNRGSPRTGAPETAMALTDSSGTAQFTFTVTRQPGDNFRVATNVCDATPLNSMSVIQGVNGADIVDAQGAPVPTERLSPLLTVWRRLWVERDSMAAPQMSEVTISGVVDSITRDSPVLGQSTVDLGLNLPDDLSDLNLFEEGRIVFQGCPAGQESFPIIESTSKLVLDDEVIILGLPAACADGSAYQLFDDDSLTALPHFPDGGSLITSAFADAYVLPIYADAFQSIVAFNMHLSDSELQFGIGWNNGDFLSSTSTFWSCLIVGCWEADEDYDADPDFCFSITTPTIPRDGAELGDFGVTVDSKGDSAIFLQAIIDQASCANTSDEAHTVVHEIGHTCGQHSQHIPGSIMEAGAPRIENSFAPESIRIFREQVTW